MHPTKAPNKQYYSACRRAEAGRNDRPHLDRGLFLLACLSNFLSSMIRCHRFAQLKRSPTLSRTMQTESNQYFRLWSSSTKSVPLFQLGSTVQLPGSLRRTFEAEEYFLVERMPHCPPTLLCSCKYRFHFASIIQTSYLNQRSAKSEWCLS